MASSSISLNGKVAIVTGSSAGIGAAIALEFARLGANVTLHGRQKTKLDSVLKKYQDISLNKEKPLVVIGDVVDKAVREMLINDTIKRHGRLDILVNNAGYYESASLSSDFETSRLDRMLDVHTKAPFHLTKLAIPHLIKTKGNIINISSVASLKQLLEPMVEYSMAKAAMDHLTKFTAKELGPKGVRANSINPGLIKTDIFNPDAARKNLMPELTTQGPESFADFHALKRIGTVQEVSPLAGFLASDEASFITGAIITVDGGWNVA